MNEKEILTKIKEKVKYLLKNEATGHDHYHIERVVNNTLKICKTENCDVFYAELIAWLHDVGDYKIHGGMDKTAEIIPELLAEFNFSEEKLHEIITDVQSVGFKGGFGEKNAKIEVQIVQDADRLDAMGAIGIARAFAYGGKKRRLLHDPEFNKEEFRSEEEYKNSSAPTLQHFYDKLLKLKYLMNTETGKKLSLDRHEFLETYLRQFYREWNG